MTKRVLKFESLQTALTATNQAATEALASAGVNPDFISYDTGVLPDSTGAETGDIGAYFTSDGLWQKLEWDGSEWQEVGEPISTKRYVDDVSGLFEETETYNIGSGGDYGDFQSAIDDLTRTKQDNSDVRINLHALEGFRPLSGIKVENGDFRRFWITSEDEDLLVHDDFEGGFITGFNAVIPVLATNVDMNFKGWNNESGNETGSCITMGAVDKPGGIGFVKSGVVIKNVERSAYRLFNSWLMANNTTIDGGNYRAIHCTHASTCGFRGGKVFNLSGNNTAIHCSHGSIVNHRNPGAEIENVGRGIFCTGVSRVQSGARIINANSTAVEAEAMSVIRVNGVDGAQRGVRISGAGSSVQCLDNILNITDEAVVCDNGGLFELDSARRIDGADVGVQNDSGGKVVLSGCTIENIEQQCILSRNSETVLNNATIEGSQNNHNIAASGGNIEAQDATIRDSPSGRSNVFLIGCRANLRDATLSNAGDFDIEISGGAIVQLRSTTYASANRNPNEITSKGIIFDD